MTAAVSDPRDGQHRAALSPLLARVRSARAYEAAQAGAVHRPGNAAALWDARHATLTALLDYAAAIEALSYPVPRGMQLEIQMHRILCRPA